MPVRQEDGMTGSIYTADRITHIKIVVLGLLAATFIAALGIGIRVANPGDAIFTARGLSVCVPPAAVTAGTLPIIR